MSITPLLTTGTERLVTCEHSTEDKRGDSVLPAHPGAEHGFGTQPSRPLQFCSPVAGWGLLSPGTPLPAHPDPHTPGLTRTHHWFVKGPSVPQRGTDPCLRLTWQPALLQPEPHQPAEQPAGGWDSAHPRPRAGRQGNTLQLPTQHPNLAGCCCLGSHRALAWQMSLGEVAPGHPGPQWALEEAGEGGSQEGNR